MTAQKPNARNGELLAVASSALSISIVSAACLLLYVGLGVIYGSYVGLNGRHGDMRFVAAKMSRALMTYTALQIPLLLLLSRGIELVSKSRHRPPLTSRMMYTIVVLAGVNIAALGLTFVTGQVGFAPTVKLIEWLDNTFGAGLR